MRAAVFSTFYLLKVGFRGELQLLQVGGSELTLEVTVGNSQRPLSTRRPN